ncbi:hypothetical protein DEO72_LG2g4095 [Vigna unguiculata]|uniref:Uncharacterized protein n=1 Tax=Vigna unguiculata TaxID=3917 RepID=A0A4D6L5G9_VIGUN|nr:hypothetical protein DEO72_LG2g4095 [Vigna unguiculata]
MGWFTKAINEVLLYELDAIHKVIKFDHEHDFTQEFPLLLGKGDELNIVTQQANLCVAPKGGENELMFYSLDAHNNSNSSQYISQESSYSNNSDCSGDDTVFICLHMLTNNLYQDLASDKLEIFECNQMEPVVFPAKRKLDDVPVKDKIKTNQRITRKKLMF